MGEEYHVEIFDPSCVLALKFEEGAGTIVRDCSVYKNNGTVSGASFVPGVYGKALQFDGVDDYVRVNDSESLHVTAITIAAWIYPTGWGENNLGRIVDKNYNTCFAFGVRSATPNSVAFYVAGSTYTSAANSITLNNWQHVVVTFDATLPSDQVKFYINGQLAGTATRTTPIPVTTNALYIGNRAENDRTFSGKIDELRMYNRSLTASEVAELYYNSSYYTKKVESFKIERNLNDKSYLDLTLDNTENFNVSEGNVVSVEIKSHSSEFREVFRGKIESVKKGTTAEGEPTLEIHAVDYASVLETQPIYKEYSSSTATSILLDMLSVFPDISTFNVGNNASTLDFTAKGENRLSAVQDLSSRTGWDWYIDPSQDFHFFQRESISSGMTINVSDLENYSYKKDTSQIINRVTVLGAKFTIPQVFDSWTEVDDLSNWTGSPNSPAEGTISDRLAPRTGKSSIKEEATSASSLFLKRSFSSIDFTKPWSPKQLTLDIGFITDSPATHLYVILETDSSNYFYRDLISKFDTSGGSWKNISCSLGPNSTWDTNGSPSWSSITALKILITFSSSTKASLFVDSLAFLDARYHGYSESTSSQNTWGLREVPNIVKDNIYSDFECQKLADTIIAENKDPKEIIENTVLYPAWEELNLGETITLTVPEGSWTKRILKLIHNYSDGELSTAITLSQESRTLSEILGQYDRQLEQIAAEKQEYVAGAPPPGTPASSYYENITQVPDYVPSTPAFSVTAEEIDTPTYFDTWLKIDITKVPEAGGYVVQYKKNTESLYEEITAPQPETGSTITVKTPSLEASSTYDVRVAAYSQKGTQGNWGTTQVVTASNNVAPPQPYSLVATPIINGAILDWSFSGANDFSHFNVYVGTSSPPSTKVGETVRAPFVWRMKDTDAYTDYYFGVKSVDTAGNTSDLAISSTFRPEQIEPIDLQVESRPWQADIKFSPRESPDLYGVIDVTNMAGTGDPKVVFADGSTISLQSTVINVRDSLAFLYWQKDSNQIQYTNNYTDAVGEGKGLLAGITAKLTSSTQVRYLTAASSEISGYKQFSTTNTNSSNVVSKSKDYGYVAKVGVRIRKYNNGSPTIIVNWVETYPPEDTPAQVTLNVNLPSTYFDRIIVDLKADIDGTYNYVSFISEPINITLSGTLTFYVWAMQTYLEPTLFCYAYYGSSTRNSRCANFPIATISEPISIAPFSSYQPYIGTGVLAANSILAKHIKAGQINTQHVTSDSSLAIRASQIILDGTTSFINTWQGSTDATKIAGGKIETGSITAQQLAAKSITADKIDVATLTDNLILNPSAEQGTIGWSVIEGSGTLTASSSDKTEGTYSFYLDGNGFGVGCRAIPIVPGDKYTIRVKVRGTADATSGLYIRMNEKTSYPSGDFVTATNRDSYTDLVANGSISASWTTYEFAYQAPASRYWATFCVYNWTGGPSGLFFDEAEVRKQLGGVHIEDGAITAQKIAAQTITGDKIAAKQITTTHLAVMPENEVPDGNFELGDASIEWTAGTASTTSPYEGSYCLAVPAGINAYTKRFIPVKAGKYYHIEGYIRSETAGYNGYILVYFYKADESYLGYGTVGSSSSDTWTLKSLNFQVPTNAAFVKIRLYSSGVTHYFDAIKMWCLSDTVDIRDGAISTAKLQANCVTTNELQFDRVDDDTSITKEGALYYYNPADELRFIGKDGKKGYIPRYPLGVESVPPENLVPNPNFEWILSDTDKPALWTFYPGTATSGGKSTVSYRGKYSVYITLAGSGANGEWQSELVPIRPGALLYASVYVKGSEAFTSSLGVLHIAWYDVNKQYINEKVSSFTNVTTSWQKAEVTTTASDIPSTARYVAVHLYFGGSPSAPKTAYFDDVVLSEVRAAVPTGGVVGAVTGANWTGVTTPTGAWANMGSFTVPDVDVEVYFVEVLVHNDAPYLMGCVRIYNVTTGEYYPTVAPVVRVRDYGHDGVWGSCGMCYITIPKNVRNNTLQIHFYNQQNIETHWVEYAAWGHSPHAHR